MVDANLFGFSFLRLCGGHLIDLLDVIDSAVWFLWAECSPLLSGITRQISIAFDFVSA